MDRRIGTSNSSVEDASVKLIHKWTEYTHLSSSILEAIEAQMPAVRNCNAADNSTRYSAECANLATMAAGLAAELISNCSNLPFRADDKLFTVGSCSRSYMPVRAHPGRSCPLKQPPLSGTRPPPPAAKDPASILGLVRGCTCRCARGLSTQSWAQQVLTEHLRYPL
jgi:hypothetical protein